MDDVRCPKCRGGLRTCHRALGYEAVCAEDCGFVGPMLPEPRMALEACRHLCWQGVCDRLPTPEEEAAHRARHGEGAGWMVRITGGAEFRDSGASRRWHDPGALAQSRYRRYALDGVTFESYPHVNGRPVAGPEGR